MAESTSFIGVFPASFTRGSAKRTRRFVREEDVDALQRLTGVDLLVYKMTSPVVPRRKTPKLARRLFVPRRRERPAEPGERQTVRLHGNTIRNVMQVRQRTAARRLRGDEIEVFVVALDPVERRARTADTRHPPPRGRRDRPRTRPRDDAPSPDRAHRNRREDRRRRRISLSLRGSWSVGREQERADLSCPR